MVVVVLEVLLSLRLSNSIKLLVVVGGMEEVGWVAEVEEMMLFALFSLKQNPEDFCEVKKQA